MDLDAFHHLDLNPEAKLLQLVDEKGAVNQVDRWRTVPCGLLAGLTSESTRGDDEALVRPPDHRAAEVTYNIWAQIAPVAFALEQHIEADQAANSDGAVSVDTAVTTSASNLNLDESSLSEYALAEPFKRSWGNVQQSLEKLSTPVTVRAGLLVGRWLLLGSRRDAGVVAVRAASAELL